MTKKLNLLKSRKQNDLRHNLNKKPHLSSLYLQEGEGRACWSLGNAHSAMGDTEQAYHYASRHLEISKDTGDRMGQATAQVNLSELAKTLGFPDGQVPAGHIVNSQGSPDR